MLTIVPLQRQHTRAGCFLSLTFCISLYSSGGCCRPIHLTSSFCVQAMNYPLLISAAGILCCLLTTFIATDLRPARMVSEIENTLKYQLIISTLLATPVRPSSHVLG